MTTDLNPDGNPSIRDAIKEYEDRTLLRATKATPIDVFAPQGILTTLGPVHAITYTGTLQGDSALYEHTFEGDAGPLLVVDETNAIHLVGGEYHVSDLGIEDGAGPMPRNNPWDEALYAGQTKWAQYRDDKEERAAAKLEKARYNATEAIRAHKPKIYLDANPEEITDLSELGARISIFSSRDDGRPDISMAKVFKSEDLPGVPDGLRYAVVTDGHRLAFLPVSAGIEVELIQSKHLAFDPGDVSSFPDVSRVFPSPTSSAVFETDAIKKAISLAEAEAASQRLGSKDADHEPRLRIEQTEDYDLRIVPLVTSAKYGNTNLEAFTLSGEGGSGPAQAWLFNIKYVKDAISGHDGSISIGLTDPFSPILISRDDGEIHVVMPMRDDIKNPHGGTMQRHDWGVLNGAASINFPMATLTRVSGESWKWSLSPTYSVPRTRYASNQISYPIGTIEEAIAAYSEYIREIPHDNPIDADEARRLELAATTAEERHHWRRKKGEAMRRGNPVVTNRISPNSPIENAGVLAMAMPGGGPYGLPQVNAGALAAAPDYPGDYDFPGVTNGSHGLLGPQIRRNVPGQPIANPAIKADGKWHRLQASRGPGSGLSYLLDAGDVWAEIGKYQPRKYPTSRSLASDYLDWHGQELPANAPWVAIGYIGSLRQTLRGAPSNPPESVTSHKTLKAAKRAAEKALKGIRAR